MGSSQTLPQLGEPEVDEAADALADPRLLLDQAHREAGGLAQLGAGERIAHRRLIDHAQGRQCARVDRIALGALQAPLGEVLGAHRVDQRDREIAGPQVADQRHPVVAARLEDHPRELALARQPAVQLVEALAGLRDAQDLAPRGERAVLTEGDRVRGRADVDADRVHASSSFDPGELALSVARDLTLDHRSATRPPRSPDHRSPTKREGRRLTETVSRSGCWIGRSPVSPRGSAEVWTL